MRRHPAVPILLALCLVELVSILVLRGRVDRLEAELAVADSVQLVYHATADSALAVAAGQVQRAEQSYQLYVQAQEWADSTIDAVYAELSELRPRIVEIRAAPVPVVCAPIVAQRDSLIDRYRQYVTTLRQAYDRQVEASLELRIAYDTASATRDMLAATIEARPEPRGTWTPRVSAAAGIDTGGMWDAGLRLRTERIDLYAGLRDGERYARLGLSYPLF